MSNFSKIWAKYHSVAKVFFSYLIFNIPQNDHVNLVLMMQLKIEKISEKKNIKTVHVMESWVNYG